MARRRIVPPRQPRHAASQAGNAAWRLIRHRRGPEAANKAFIIHQRTLLFPEAASVDKLGDCSARLEELMNEYDSRPNVEFSDVMRKVVFL